MLVGGYDVYSWRSLQSREQKSTPDVGSGADVLCIDQVLMH